MPGYFWRVPTTLGVMAFSAVGLFAAGVLGWIFVRRQPSTRRKVAITAALGLLSLLSALALRADATRIARAYAIDVAHVDPGPPGYLPPVLFAGFAFLAGKRALRDVWGSGSAVLFYLWLLTFTAANVIERCNPGWCSMIGFPFAWRSWSDSILTFGDPDAERWRQRFEIAGITLKAAIDLATFAAVAELLTHVRIPRRRT